MVDGKIDSMCDGDVEITAPCPLFLTASNMALWQTCLCGCLQEVICQAETDSHSVMLL